MKTTRQTLTYDLSRRSTPTAEQIGRLRRREAKALRCRRCRQSELDGAMFTTDPAARICDDCY